MKQTVLIITSSIDSTVDYIIKEYSDLVDFFRLNIDNFENYKFTIGDKKFSWQIKDIANGKTITKNKIHSIYYRKPIFPDLSEYEVEYHTMIQKDILALITGMADDFEGTVLTKPKLLRTAENKVTQLLFSIKNNWLIPESFIGNSSESCKPFSEEKSIIKPLTIAKVYKKDKCEIYQTNYFTGGINDISLTPIYLQKYIQKKYEVRITIIEKFFYSVRIDTKDKLDWRKDYENHVYTLIECPEVIRKNCIFMLNHFGLSFGAFDYIVTPDDKWIFLEVNPNGQWLWLEEALNLDISKKIVEYLAGENK